MVASNPMGVPGGPSSRPMLPAERDINESVNGFNAAVVDFLKGERVDNHRSVALSNPPQR